MNEQWLGEQNLISIFLKLKMYSRLFLMTDLCCCQQKYYRKLKKTMKIYLFLGKKSSCGTVTVNWNMPKIVVGATQAKTIESNFLSSVFVKAYTSQSLLIKSQQYKRQNNVWNFFKVDNKDVRETSLTWFWCLYC